jgi:glycosyltransferase involved in cell wall biosynthesis
MDAVSSKTIRFLKSKPRPDRQLYLAWVSFQRRQVSMGSFFGFEPIFMPLRHAPRFLRPVQYCVQYARTLVLLWRERPSVVWVQLPQPPLLAAVIRHKRLFEPALRIVADCHNLMFVPPWSKWPGVRKLLNRADFVIVHTAAVAEVVRRMGIFPSLVQVLRDRPAFFTEAKTQKSQYPTVLFLASFDYEEPVEEVIQAARLATDLQFLITGDTRRATGLHDLSHTPANLVFLGYLDVDSLDFEIMQASIILCLTKKCDEQLSCVAEAVGAGKPMVLSNTPVLRAMVPKGGIFVDTSEPASIAAGCRFALAEMTRLGSECAALREEWERRWLLDARFIHECLATF